MSPNRRNIPSTRRLLAFSAACRHGNFTRAGNELHITQAAVSRQVRELEEELGVCLFTRRARDVVPTEAALSLIENINSALTDIAQSIAQVKKTPMVNRHLTICTDHGLASHYLLPLISQFEAELPGFSVRIISSNAELATITEHYDLAISYDRDAPRNFTAHTIEVDEIFPVGAPSLIGDRRITSIEALADMPLIELAPNRKNLIHWPSFLLQQGYHEPINPKVIYDSYAVALDAAINGQGLIFGWQLLVARYLKSGVLKRLGSWSIPVPLGVQLYVPEQKNQSDVSKTFVEWLCREKKVSLGDCRYPQIQ